MPKNQQTTCPTSHIHHPPIHHLPIHQRDTPSLPSFCISLIYQTKTHSVDSRLGPLVERTRRKEKQPPLSQNTIQKMPRTRRTSKSSAFLATKTNVNVNTQPVDEIEVLGSSPKNNRNTSGGTTRKKRTVSTRSPAVVKVAPSSSSQHIKNMDYSSPDKENLLPTPTKAGVTPYWKVSFPSSVVRFNRNRKICITQYKTPLLHFEVLVRVHFEGYLLYVKFLRACN